jgi:hypothetical protein
LQILVNPLVASVAEPPIAEAHGWIAGRSFPAGRPLLDLAQAVPGYTPVMAVVAVLFGLPATTVFGLLARFGDLPRLLGAWTPEDR